MSDKMITLSRAALDELVTRAALEAVEKAQKGHRYGHGHRHVVEYEDGHMAEYEEDWSSDSDEAPPSMVERTKGKKKEGAKGKKVRNGILVKLFASGAS